MTDLGGRHAVITGGGTGIGAAVACRFAVAGARVTVMGRRREPIAAIANEIGGQAVGIDVADAASVERAFAEARAAAGPVAILVNNAGVAPSAGFMKTEPEAFRRTLDINLTGAFLCSQAVMPGMIEAGWGRVIMVASTAGLKGYPYVSAYVASKHGLVGLARALAIEYARTGITINSLCPGYTDTDIVERSVRTIMEKTGRNAEDARAELVKSNPQRRLIAPEEVAGAAMWLCSEEARSVTGQAIAVAGGEVT